MRRFDCLSADCSLFGSHLIEASAGTGKTFAIEHIFVRLLLESEMEAEKILAVTFTRFAASDLKRRIRENLEEALKRLRLKNGEWEYLRAHFSSKQAQRKLSDGLAAFDRCQIFTIHGFCYRMMQEFAFEADLGFSLQDPDRENRVPKRLRSEARKFLESGIHSELVCPEQMAVLFKDFDSIDALAEGLLQKEKGGKAVPFSVLQEQFITAWKSWNGIEEIKLLEDFEKIAKGCKAMKGDFAGQLSALVRGDFRKLLAGRGTLFAFLDESNRKVRAKPPEQLHYPGFFEQAAREASHLVERAALPKNILECLRSAWREIEEPLLAQEQWVDPDMILARMRNAIEKPSFSARVRQKYRAVIIDEFQDTDPLQWEIFLRLFTPPCPSPLLAFYLIGDPKQSIYRFRQADVYTYFQARELLGGDSLFFLDTNYRSSPKLLRALNALFARNWLSLPKTGQTISSPPLKAGLSDLSDEMDGKGAVHILMSQEKAAFENCLLPYAIAEIERLAPSVPLGSFAVLVKDRYQAQTARRLFQSRSIPVIARSREHLGETFAFQAIRELFEHLAFPRDPTKRRIVESGPFFSLSGDGAMEKMAFGTWCRRILECPGEEEFQRDKKQVVEAVLAWEAKGGFSIHGLLRFLEEFAALGSPETGRCCRETEEDAVQILTLHVSKGLEFDVVFALGLTARPPHAEEEAEEIDAEKLRQLYVAMTRAKRRLYIPILSESSRGSSSPMELFRQILEEQEGALLPFLERLSQKESVTYEQIAAPFPLAEKTLGKKRDPDAPPLSFPEAAPSFLQSFTSLAQTQEWRRSRKSSRADDLCTVHTMPKGTETGIIIHEIFEALFASSIPIWKDRRALESLIESRLAPSFLKSWGKPIQTMVWNTLNAPLLPSFCLAALEPGQLQAEMEFLFFRSPHYVQGSIDLVFLHEGKIYFADWKTNWLGEDDAAYARLDEVMAAHDYWLQAKLYAEALRRHVKRFYKKSFEEIYGGAFYLFLRGNAMCRLHPELHI